MKKLHLILITLASGATFSQAALYNLSGVMDGTQANAGAGTGSSATGSISGTYDDVSKELTWSISWNSAALTGTETALHFHGPAGPGANAGVQINIGIASNPANGNATLTAGQETDLLNNLWYANLHTSTFGGGEIRGQVLTSPIPEPSTTLLAITALPFLLRRKRN